MEVSGLLSYSLVTYKWLSEVGDLSKLVDKVLKFDQSLISLLPTKVTY